MLSCNKQTTRDIIDITGGGLDCHDAGNSTVRQADNQPTVSLPL